jgi:flagellar motor protein MotB
LEIDAQNSLSFARFSIPLHYVAFGGDGKGKQDDMEPANLGEMEEDLELEALFEGRRIILPNVSVTMQLESKLTKDGHTFRMNTGGAPMQQEELQQQQQQQQQGQQQQQQQRQEEQKAQQNNESEEFEDDFGSKYKRSELLEVRAVIGPLKASLTTSLISQALSCVTKLEKQLSDLSEMWIESEERKRNDAPPSVEMQLNKTAAGVHMWYRISVIFVGVNVRAVCPTSVLLVRVSDLMVEIGNEAAGHLQNIRDDMHVRRSFRDFYLTLALPELSVWLLSPTIKYREQAHDLIFERESETDGIYLSFMTHASVSNFYMFDKKAEGGGDSGKLDRSSGIRGGRRRASVGDVSSDADSDDPAETGERDPYEVVSLADVLQNVVVQIHNTVIVLQPQAPIQIGQMVTHYLTAANEFRRGYNAVMKVSFLFCFVFLKEKKIIFAKFPTGKQECQRKHSANQRSCRCSEGANGRSAGRRRVEQRAGWRFFVVIFAKFLRVSSNCQLGRFGSVQVEPVLFETRFRKGCTVKAR